MLIIPGVQNGTNLGLSSQRTEFKSYQYDKLKKWLQKCHLPSLSLHHPMWKMMGLDQLWYFDIESYLLLCPISIELKAHFFSFSPVRMIDSSPFSNLITYFYIFVGYYVFLSSLFHMNDQYKLSSSSKALPSFFTIFFMTTFWILFPKS